MTAATTSIATFRRSRRPRIAAGRALIVTAATILLVLIGLAVIGPWIEPHDPAKLDVALGVIPPDARHLLGTDELGRDILSRIIAGAGTALLPPLLIAVGTTTLGTALGLLAGYRGGWLDGLLMRASDLMFALPGLLILIVVVGVAGGSQAVAVIALIVLGAPVDIRVVRSHAIAQRELAYVDAARTMGVPGLWIMVRHILPNILPTVVANLLLNFVSALVALAGLAFLGIGLASGTPDWGLMISENRAVLDLNPWAALAPALVITVTAVSATILGDGIYERFDSSSKDTE